MKEIPQRKPNRLKDYDYSQDGAYFVTICAKNRLELFATIDVGAAFCRPCLTHAGKIIENEISILSSTYEGVSVDYYVIMPNHVHMIIGISDMWRHEGNGRNAEEHGRHAAPTVSRMINQWKRAVSIKIGYSVWQKSFHDHIIRNENDYRRVAEYIENNPQRWTEDCFYIADPGVRGSSTGRGGILPPVPDAHGRNN